LEEIIFEIFNISENNIISVELAKVLRYTVGIYKGFQTLNLKPKDQHLRAPPPHPQARALLGVVSVFSLAYQGKDIVFRLIIEYSSLRDFGP
jgi:hypothetical protein